MTTDEAPTRFVETNALLAVSENEESEAVRLLRTMYDTEVQTLGDHAERLSVLCAEEMHRRSGTTGYLG